MSSNAGGGHTRLKPPFRGDYLAGGVLVLALVLFLTAWVVLSGEGLITFEGEHPLLPILNGLSLGLTLAAFVWSFGKDLLWLWGEEKDVTYVLGPGQQTPEAVLFRHRGAKEDATVRKVQTLIDDRMVRVLGQDGSGGGAPVRESELRAVASFRSAQVGTFARYSSGLLLLLTVLGTFMGVKYALDPLQEALLHAGEGGATTTALAVPLKAVAASFGSNLTALVGAIAIGLGAFGLAVGRQNMLARLEQASSLYIYPRVKPASSTDRFVDAFQRLSSASASLDRLAGDLGGLGEGIDELTGTVRDSMGDMRNALTLLMQDQPRLLAEQSQRTVDKIERQITETVVAVQHATALYQTLVERLEQERESLGRGAEALKGAVDELKLSRESFGTYVDSATQRMDERLKQMEDAAVRQAEASEKVQARFQSMDDGLGKLLPQVTVLVQQLEVAEQRQNAAFLALQTQIGDQVAERLAPVAAVKDAAEALQRELHGLPEALRRELKPALLEPPPAQAPSPERMLEPTLRRLAAVMEKIDRRQSASLWQRLTGRANGRS